MNNVSIIDNKVEVDIIAIVNAFIADEIEINDENYDDCIQKYIKNMPLTELKTYKATIADKILPTIKDIWNEYSQYPICLKNSGECFNINKSGDLLRLKTKAVNICNDYIEKLSGKYKKEI